MSVMEMAIRAEGLSKRFGDIEALAGLDLEVAQGEVFGYRGPNGAGKTTTILLLDEPTSGLGPLMEREFRQCVLEANAAGQTVFLSSHILSEVEALCDRVAILRAGRLVEAGTLADLRHLSALSVEATFSSAPPDLPLVPGVTDVEVDGNRVRLQVHGSVEPLLQR